MKTTTPTQRSSAGIGKIIYAIGAIIIFAFGIIIYCHEWVGTIFISSPTNPSLPGSSASYSGAKPSIFVAFPASQASTASSISKQRVEAVNFQRENDLWGFSLRSSRSNDFSAVFEASIAVQECVGLLNLSSEFQTFMSGVPSRLFLGTASLARQKAFDELRQRCKGFFDEGKPKSYELAVTIRTQLQRLKNTILAEDLTRPGLGVENREILTLLYSNSSSAILEGLSRLSLRMENSPQMHQASDAENTFALLLAASKQASCKLGSGCGLEDFAQLMDCTLHGNCIPIDMSVKFTKEEVSKIDDYSHKMVKSIISRSVASILIAGKL